MPIFLSHRKQIKFPITRIICCGGTRTQSAPLYRRSTAIFCTNTTHYHTNDERTRFVYMPTVSFHLQSMTFPFTFTAHLIPYSTHAHNHTYTDAQYHNTCAQCLDEPIASGSNEHEIVCVCACLCACIGCAEETETFSKIGNPMFELAFSLRSVVSSYRRAVFYSTTQSCSAFCLTLSLCILRLCVCFSLECSVKLNFSILVLNIWVEAIKKKERIADTAYILEQNIVD